MDAGTLMSDSSTRAKMATWGWLQKWVNPYGLPYENLQQKYTFSHPGTKKSFAVLAVADISCVKFVSVTHRFNFDSEFKLCINAFEWRLLNRTPPACSSLLEHFEWIMWQNQNLLWFKACSFLVAISGFTLSVIKSVTGQGERTSTFWPMPRGVRPLIFYEMLFHCDPSVPQSHSREPHEQQKWPAKEGAHKNSISATQPAMKTANDAERDTARDRLFQRESLEMSGCANWTAVAVNPLCGRWHSADGENLTPPEDQHQWLR